MSLIRGLTVQHRPCIAPLRWALRRRPSAYMPSACTPVPKSLGYPMLRLGQAGTANVRRENRRMLQHCMAGSPAAEPRPTGEPTEAAKVENFVQNTYFYLNCAYWSLLLVAVFTGNEILSKVAEFQKYSAIMCFISCLAVGWFLTRWAMERGRAESAADRVAALRYGWNALLWAGFVLFYTAPPYTLATAYTGNVGIIAAAFGFLLSLTSAFTIGSVRFENQGNYVFQEYKELTNSPGKTKTKK
jgi:hypothetical protein